MAFSAEALTAGLKPQNSVLSRERRTSRGPKAVSEEVELNVRIRTFALPVPTVDDLGFRRMHFQAALCQAALEALPGELSFLLVPAVDQPIVCIPTPMEGLGASASSSRSNA